MRAILIVCLACATQLQPTTVEAACAKEAWSEFVRDLVAAQNAFVDGDPEPMKSLWSHTDDVTLMGAWGGHERGWSLIGPRLDWVSRNSSDGTYGYDEISSIVGSDLALFVQIEHFSIKKWMLAPCAICA